MADRAMLTYLPMGINSSSDIKDGVIGEIISCFVPIDSEHKTTIENFLPCDGQVAYKVTDYPELAEFYIACFGNVRKFSQTSDPDNTFRTPNLTNRFLKGSYPNNAGSLQSAGVPEIEAYWRHDRAPWQQRGEGCFRVSGWTDGANNDSGNSSRSYINFKASLGEVHNGVYRNDIYGKSETVTPENISVAYYIRCKKSTITITDRTSLMNIFKGEYIYEDKFDIDIEDDEVQLIKPWQGFDKIEVAYCIGGDNTIYSSFFNNCKLGQVCNSTILRDNGSTYGYFSMTLTTNPDIDKAIKPNSHIKFSNIHCPSMITIRYIRGYYARKELCCKNQAGEIRIFTSDVIPDGWVLCDGSSYNVNDVRYSTLFKTIGYTYGGSGELFKVPDFRRRFGRCANNANQVGRTLEAGLPDIMGCISGARMPWQKWGNGCFYISGYIDGADRDGSACNTITFNASKGEYYSVDGDGNPILENNIYGKADTVQPDSLCLAYIISLY